MKVNILLYILAEIHVFSCNEARKYLLSILPNYSNNIYYFNTDTFRKTPEFHQILSDFKVEEVPTMVKISNGAYLDSLLLISDNGTLVLS